MDQWLARSDVPLKRVNCVRRKLVSGRSHFHFYASRGGPKFSEDGQTELYGNDSHVAYEVIRHTLMGKHMDLDDAIAFRATTVKADVATVVAMGGDPKNFRLVFNGGADANT